MARPALFGFLSKHGSKIATFGVTTLAVVYVGPVVVLNAVRNYGSSVLDAVVNFAQTKPVQTAMGVGVAATVVTETVKGAVQNWDVNRRQAKLISDAEKLLALTEDLKSKQTQYEVDTKALEQAQNELKTAQDSFQKAFKEKQEILPDLAEEIAQETPKEKETNEATASEEITTLQKKVDELQAKLTETGNINQDLLSQIQGLQESDAQAKKIQELQAQLEEKEASKVFEDSDSESDNKDKGKGAAKTSTPLRTTVQTLAKKTTKEPSTPEFKSTPPSSPLSPNSLH